MFFHLKPAWLQAALWILLMSSGLAQAQEMPNRGLGSNGT